MPVKFADADQSYSLTQALEKIQDWFAKLEPDPPPSFAATLKELYNGLQIAGV